MAQVILGMPDSAKFQAESDRFNSHRRRILDLYPTGGAPLTGILSMIESEPVTDSIHTWWEDRYQSPKTTARGTNPLTSTAPSTGDADDGTNLANGAVAVTTALYLKVASTALLRKGLVVQLEGASGNIQYWVESVTRGVSAEATNGYIKVYPLRAYTAAAADDAATNIVRVIGSAMGEGATGLSVQPISFIRPYSIMNTTQIFRTGMQFTGSVLQMGLKYDSTGPYKRQARKKVVEHMTGIERAILFGRRSTTSRTALDGSGLTETVRTMSGIEEALTLWDAGSTGVTIDGATYAPYSHKTASTTDTDDEKRIISNAAGTVSVKKFNQWAERVSRVCSNKTRDKMVLCGNTALLAMSELFRLNSNITVTPGDKIAGLEFTTMHTTFGKFHFVTHPMFNEDPNGMGKWMLFLDPHCFSFRPLTNRDTKLLVNRQNPGDDFRKDEYLTEALLEFNNIEANMLVKNVTNYVEA